MKIEIEKILVLIGLNRRKYKFWKKLRKKLCLKNIKINNFKL